MNNDLKDIDLDETSTTLELSLIRLRCSELLEDTDELSGLSLEDPVEEKESFNPYNRG